MRVGIIILLLTGLCVAAEAQQNGVQGAANNIYTIKQLFLEKALQGKTEQEEENGDDNDLARFNRWFNMIEPRTYPTGNLPRPDALLQAYNEAGSAARNADRTTGATWQSLGPNNVPSNYDGIGRINCIVIDPTDTNTLYIGAACGGVWISHNHGATWASNSDNFPSLSIADIAVNPHNTDTIYAATGDGYGYVDGPFNIFWGGLYSAGVMKSTDNGSTWTTTGLSYMQSENNIIQRLLIHPNNPNILLAATTNGVLRSTDAGATWDTTTPDHIYSIAFRPGQPDTVYAINTSDLIVSYDAGATWSTLCTHINLTNDRCTIGVTPESPNSIWVLNDSNYIVRSYDGGHNFYPLTTSPAATASFYGYYDRVLGISPTDSNYILACGEYISKSANDGNSWAHLVREHEVHVDNHAITFNPLNTNTIYSGNDGGIAVTYNGGASWTDLGNGLTISQIYRMSSSRQDPYIMLCGLQDNGTFYNDSITWAQSNAPSGDGMDNAIHPLSDYNQVASYQYGNFFISHDQGATYSGVGFPTGIAGSGQWTAPVAFNPNNADTIYFGFNAIYASYDGGTSANAVSGSLFSDGAVSLVVAPSATNTLYAADNSSIMRSTDGGATWVNVSGTIPLAITSIAVDYSNPMIVYVTVSGYVAGEKVYKSTTGGGAWTNISEGLPNLPADCIAVDSSVPGGLYVGMDMGVYYRDNNDTTWAPYNTGLPNVIVDDLDINYTNFKIRAATYGRGVWECSLKNSPSNSVIPVTAKTGKALLSPNPTANSWKIMFTGQSPANFTVRVMDITGKVVMTQSNKELIDAAKLPNGNYVVDIVAEGIHESLKAVKQ